MTERQPHCHISFLATMAQPTITTIVRVCESGDGQLLKFSEVLSMQFEGLNVFLQSVIVHRLSQIS